jgi:hypothetical protein
MDPLTWGQLQDLLAGLAVVGVFVGVFAWSTYLAFTIYRRKQKNDMQRHMLERFSSAQDFATFVQSPAGQKYVTSFTDTVTNPMGSIINSVKIGFVLMCGGIGFLVSNAGPNSVAFRVGWVSFLVGIGFLLAALVSYFLARRIGWREKE